MSKMTAVIRKALSVILMVTVGSSYCLITSTAFAQVSPKLVGQLSVRGQVTLNGINATSGGPLPVTLSDFTGNFNSNAVKLNWKTALEQNVQQFEIEYSTDGSSFSKVGTVQATNIATGTAYNFTHSVNTSGPFFYRLKMVDTDGSFTYSNTIRINMSDFTGNIVSPSVITNGVINVNLGNTGYNTVEMIRTDGTQVFKRKIKGQNGRIQILTGALLPGIYMIRLNGEANGATQRILIQ